MVVEQILQAVRITSAEAQRAFGIVALCRPDVGLAEWKRFVRPLIQPRRQDAGVVALRDSRGCIHGLFAFRVMRVLGGEATLQVTELAALRLPGTTLVTALLRFAQALAAELGLPSISLDMHPSATWEQDKTMLETSGFALDRITMRGRVRRRRAALPAKP